MTHMKVHTRCPEDNFLYESYVQKTTSSLANSSYDSYEGPRVEDLEGPSGAEGVALGEGAEGAARGEGRAHIIILYYYII